jgi:phosphatidylethanolamine/phosphatidyl-N-methylethanolamine N-methyltransferase
MTHVENPSIRHNAAAGTSVAALVASSTMLATTAAAATYLLLQILNNSSLITIPGIGIVPHNIALYGTIGLYSAAGLSTVTTAIILKNFCRDTSFEGVQFLKHFITNPSQVGAIAPSSHALAVKITRYIDDRSKAKSTGPGRRILEIGAGTGVFTREIAKKLGPDDCLDVVEYDHGFCERLRTEFDKNPQVHIHETSILDFKAEPYDFIVSGLPLNAFGPGFVRETLNKYEILIKQNGTISYFEYIALEKIKKVFLFGTAYTNFCDVLDQKAGFVRKHGNSSATVLGNCPPARVQYCKRFEEETPAPLPT